MKKGIFGSLIVILLIVPQASYAFQNEPDGFRGIKWGTEIKTLKDMKLKEDDGDSKFYKRKDDKLKIGDADLQYISYSFYKNQFYLVMIGFQSLTNFTKLKETLFEQYGEGNRTNRFMERYFWFGADVSITLDYNEIRETGSISYFFKPILDQIKLDQKNKAKKGAGDL